MSILTGVRHNSRRTLFRRRLNTGKGMPVASAATITLGTDGNVFPPGATAAALSLASAANFSGTDKDSLTLCFDGTVWREIARTVI